MALNHVSRRRVPCHLIISLTLLLYLAFLSAPVAAYTALSDRFLKLIPSGGTDFDPLSGKLLAPLLIPRIPGTAGQKAAQRHFVDFFAAELPHWTVAWQNSTVSTNAGSIDVPVQNLLLRREPPWTKPGQANYLTLAAHYDSRSVPAGFVGATDGAVPCAILMHVARSIDKYVQQMHDEMAELGEVSCPPTLASRLAIISPRC